MCDKSAFRDPIYQHMHEMMQETDRVLAQIKKDRMAREQPVMILQYARD